MAGRWAAPALAAALGALAFYLFFAVTYPAASGIFVSTDGDLEAIGRGFYPFEHNANLTYAWTAPHAELIVAGLDRRIDWRLTGDVSIWRPPGVPRPRVVVSVDGVATLDRTARGPFPLDVQVGRRPGAHKTTITIDSDPPFEPGPHDPRRLGVAISAMAIRPDNDTPRAPARAAAAGMAAIAVFGATAAALGMPVSWACICVIAVAWSQAWLMTRGIAPYAAYVTHVLSLSLALGGGALALVWVVDRIRRDRLAPLPAAAVTCSLAVCYLKLMILLHPGMPMGDGVFHAHRLEDVLGGRLYFTSVTPDDYAFPYPVLLYLAAAPWSALTSDTLDRVALLRVITTVSDAAAGLLVYWMIARATADRAAALASVAWYHCIPMTAWIMTWGNLTNAFAQSLFVASLALVVGLPVQWSRHRTVALLTVVASSAMLSHPGTFAILAAVLAVTGCVYIWRGRELRAAGNGVLAAAALAVAIAVAFYYAWFPSVYLSALSRAAADAGSRLSSTPLSAKLTTALQLAQSYFGAAVIPAAAVGAWRLLRSGSRRLTLLLLAWSATWLMFLVVGILTPVDVRYHFAAFPALSIAAAFGCAWAWRSGAVLRTAAAVVLGIGAWEGIAQWTRALSPR